MRFSLLLLCLVPVSSTAAEPKVIKIWPAKPPGEKGEVGAEKVLPDRPGARKVKRITNVTMPTITIYRPKKSIDTGTSVVICPGGGYSILAWDLEGTEVANWLNSIGVTGIVLKYRVPRRPDAPRPTPPKQPLMDAQRAVSLVRSHAKEWGLNPERIGILGFSAGGHLSAHTATNFDKRAYKPIDDVDQASCRPDFVVLVYPAYLTSKKDRTKLNPEIRVSDKTPPMFFAHAGNDPIAADNSIQLYLALKKAKVPAELHVYTQGGHGFGLRKSDLPCSTWPKSCEAWMRTQKLLGTKSKE